MTIEISWNKFKTMWWIDLGICFQNTEYNPNKKYALTLSIVFFSICFRFKNKEKTK